MHITDRCIPGSLQACEEGIRGSVLPIFPEPCFSFLVIMFSSNNNTRIYVRDKVKDLIGAMG